MKILIVDDHAVDRTMLRRVLEAHGHEVTEAANGQEGLCMASSHIPDLIISDVLMPVMDGFQFLRSLKRLCTVPFLFYSAVYDESRDKQLAASLGADGYLVKPEDPVELMEEIGRIVAGAKRSSAVPEDDVAYLKRYGQVVASKLEAKVRELEETLVEYKRMEEMLRAREREFRTLAENSPDIIARYDTMCRTTYVNPQLERTLRLPAAAMLGITPMERFPGGEFRDYQKLIEKVLATGSEAEIEIVMPDIGDGMRYHHIRFVAERNNDGGIIGVLAIGRDITVRKRTEEQLRENQERLNAMTLELSLAEERERRAMAAELHDQIGQDLALARIKLGVLAKNPESEHATRLLGETRQILDSMIYDVRALTHRISPPILESGSLGAALKWLGRQVETDYGLQVEFSDDMRDKPLSEELRAVVYHAVRELLINTAKHARAVTVRVTVGRQDDSLIVEVADDGIGFDPTAINENRSIGDGFGLFNVRRRICHLGGTFAIESSFGNGTRITIGMPLSVNLANIQQGEMS